MPDPRPAPESPSGGPALDLSKPLPLRGHMALCLLGFRGSGYSDAFVAQMAGVQAALRANPAQRLRVQAEPDPICGACPNLIGGGCTLQGPDHEAHMRDHDLEVLRRVGLEAGAIITWAELQARIAGSIRGSDLAAICTTCPWLEMGVCAESVDALRATGPEPA